MGWAEGLGDGRNQGGLSPWQHSLRLLLPYLDKDFANVFPLSHVAEGIFHLGLGKHCALEGLHDSINVAILDLLCHLPPAVIGLLKKGVQQDPMESDVLQEDSQRAGRADPGSEFATL